MLYITDNFNKRGDFILDFSKEFIEPFALGRLRKLDPYRYKDAILEGCEQPDIQNFKRSVGVEVTSCDFKEMYMWYKYYEKSLLEVFRMENIKPIRFKEIAKYCFGDYAKENIKDFISEEIYLERKGKLKQLKVYEDFQELNSHDKLYYKSDLKGWELELDDNLNIVNLYPGGFYPDLIVDKLKKVLRKKEAKFKNYKKFDENNLYIQVFSASKEEYRKFEEDMDFRNCCFDHIYIYDFWSIYDKSASVYTIKTRD